MMNGQWMVCVLSHVWLFVTPWTVAHQALLSMKFSRQEYWNRLPFPTPGDLSNPGIKPMSSVFSALAGGFFTTEPPRSILSGTVGTWNGAWPQGSFLQSPGSAGQSGLMGRKVGHVVGYTMVPGLGIRTSSSESLLFLCLSLFGATSGQLPSCQSVKLLGVPLRVSGA